MRTSAGARTAESVDDVAGWLRSLDTPLPVTETVVLSCAGHGETRPTWTYVEADPRAGVARRRCLSCATSVSLLDSQDRWTWPAMWCCQGCGQSIAELVAGLACGGDDHVRLGGPGRPVRRVRPGRGPHGHGRDAPDGCGGRRRALTGLTRGGQSGL